MLIFLWCPCVIHFLSFATPEHEVFTWYNQKVRNCIIMYMQIIVKEKKEKLQVENFEYLPLLLIFVIFLLSSTYRLIFLLFFINQGSPVLVSFVLILWVTSFICTTSINIYVLMTPKYVLLPKFLSTVQNLIIYRPT